MNNAETKSNHMANMELEYEAYLIGCLFMGIEWAIDNGTMTFEEFCEYKKKEEKEKEEEN